MGSEQEAVTARSLVALVLAVERLDQHGRLRVAEPDILDGDDAEPRPKLLLQLVAGDEHLPAQQDRILQHGAANALL
jgi:hypothetical protein